METSQTVNQNEKSRVVITLFKGVLYRDSEPAVWQALLRLQSEVRQYLSVMGLVLFLDESEGYAYLKQRPEEEGEEALPRLIPRRQLGYQISLLLVLLRRRLAEFDARSGDTKLVLSREEIVDLLRVFLPESSNQAKMMDRIDTHINKIVEMGFLRRLKEQEGKFEVMRLLKAFVDAQWLEDFEQRLRSYREYATQSVESGTR